MIGYSCKYAPLELIAAYGGEALMLDAETEDFSRAGDAEPTPTSAATPKRCSPRRWI